MKSINVLRLNESRKLNEKRCKTFAFAMMVLSFMILVFLVQAFSSKEQGIERLTQSIVMASEGPGGRCGLYEGNTYSCNPGRCCSPKGWCGTSEAHCWSPGCQLSYSFSCFPNATYPLSQDGRCGPTAGTTCGSLKCCSSFGWCGSSCGAGCQSGFGICSSVTSSSKSLVSTRASTSITRSSTTTTRPSTTSTRSISATPTATGFPISVDGRCGAVFGTRCPLALPGSPKICCGDRGRCGTGIFFCGWSTWACRPLYGECGGPIPDPPKDSFPPLDPAKAAIAYTACTKPGLFALTFDDGVYNYTNRLLDILSTNNVKATFFINGYKSGDMTIEPWRSAVLKMHQQGHQIASHTYDHFNLLNLDVDGVYAQMFKNDAVFQSVLGFKPIYMRPPFGLYNPQVLTALGSWGYKVIWMNITNSDASNSAFTAMKAKFDPVFNNANPATNSFISLQHDTIQSVVDVWTQYVIDTAKARGYRFVTVAECIGDTGPWYR